MRIASFLVVAGLALGAASNARADDPPPAPAVDAWDAVPVLALRKAAEARVVEASGSEPQSYQAVKLHLKNTSNARVAVDLSGGYLTPRSRGTCQRLALGPPVAAKEIVRPGGGAEVVRLEPGEVREFVVNTCCMDAGLPAPNKQNFDAASDAMPPVREKVMRWWADNPSAPQGAVNCSIWQNSPEVRVGPGVVENYVIPKGRFAAVRNGVYYQLVDGALTSLDSIGIRRVLGNEIFQVLPTDDAVYAVMLGEDRKPKLWRLAVTGEERWSRVMDLDGTDRIHELLTVGKGGLVLVTDKGVAYHDATKDTTLHPIGGSAQDGVSARVAGDDRLLVAVHHVPPAQPTYQGGQARYEQATVFGLWSVALNTGKAEQTKRYWNVEAVVAGAGGVFALTPTEHRLRRLVGDKFVDVGGANASWNRILAVTTDVVWLVDADDHLAAVDARTCRDRFRTDVAADAAKVFAVDARTGDFAYATAGEFRLIHGDDGRQETVADK